MLDQVISGKASSDIFWRKIKSQDVIRGLLFNMKDIFQEYV